MNVKAKQKKNQVNVSGSDANIFSRQDLLKKANEIMKELKSYTWRELETGGKFTKNDKFTFISDDMLILGCDIGSEIHYVRGIDVRGRELS